MSAVESQTDPNLLSQIHVPDPTIVEGIDINSLTRQSNEGPWHGGPRQRQPVSFENWSSQSASGLISTVEPGYGYGATMSDGYSSQQEALDSGYVSLPPTAELPEHAGFFSNTGELTHNCNPAQYPPISHGQRIGPESVKPIDSQLQDQTSTRGTKRKRKGNVPQCNHCGHQPKNDSDAVWVPYLAPIWANY